MATYKEIVNFEAGTVEVYSAELDNMAPFVDQSIGLVMPFYGYTKLLFLAYLCVTRSSGGSAIYRLFIFPRLRKYSKTIDLTASFLLLVAEWLFQISLMLVVLPFVAVWRWMKGLRGKLGRLDTRSLLARMRVGTRTLLVRLKFWRWRWKARNRPDTAIGAVVPTRRETDGDIQIEVTSATSPAEANGSETTETATTSFESSAPASTQTPRLRTSLLPTSNEITAYTLSSPQTLRRAVDQAREIYRDVDSRRRDVGKKRGEGEVVKGLMKRRMKEMEEQRGKGKSIDGSAKTAHNQSAVTKAASQTSIPPTKPLLGRAQLGTSGAAPARTVSRLRTGSDKPADRAVGQPKVKPARERTRTATSKATARPVPPVSTIEVASPGDNIANGSSTGNAGHSSTMQLGNISTAALGSNENAAGSVNLPGATQAPLAFAAYPSLTSLEQGDLNLPSPSETRYPATNGIVGLGFGSVANGDYIQTPTSSFPTGVRQTPFFPGGYPLAPFDSPIAPRIAGQYVPFSLTPHSAQPPSIATHLDSDTTVVSAEVLESETVSPRHLQPPTVVSPQQNGEGSTAAPARPQLRKNNSLGLVGTLDAMRSPSLEPKNMQTASQGPSPFSESPRAFPSRLRQDMTAFFGPDRIHAPPSSDMPGAIGENGGHPTYGVHRPVLPLPVITPLTSPSIPQREPGSAGRRARMAGGGDIRLNEEGQSVASDQQATFTPMISNEEEPGTLAQSPTSGGFRETDSSPDVPVKTSSSETTVTVLKGGPTKPAGSIPKRATRAVRPTAPAKPEPTPRVVAPKATRSSILKASTIARPAGKKAEIVSNVQAKGKIRPGLAAATTTNDQLELGETMIVPGIDIPTGIPSRKRKIPPVDKTAKSATSAASASRPQSRARRALNTVTKAQPESDLSDAVVAAVTPDGSNNKKQKLANGTAIPQFDSESAPASAAPKRSLRAPRQG
ncbi:hypothetical protein QFC21_002609 [Naganishia friedmannii]|uniref:Uncharacterized protein n=1 Tax=Naganishia friedmannii TaxID=89922 RepID=A0ACC2VWL6_9TREE|nr:hypothetical protein QFC21_002609 [Naganishia friedmannii]